MDGRKYIQHFLLLFTGTAVGQALNLASYPFLARLYTPAQFGVFAMFVAASAIPGAIACGRFDLAIPTVPAFGRFAILWLSYAISASLALVAGLAAAIVWTASGQAGAPLLALLLAAAVFLTGYCSATNMFLLRHDNYRLTSASVVARTGITVALQVALGFLWPTPLALILGFCAGLVAQAAILWTTTRAQARLPRPRPRQMRAMFGRYRRQVTVDIPSTLLAALSLNVMPFFLQFLYGVQSVGFYSLGQRIAMLPLQLFNDALSQVFFQKAARAEAEHGTFWPEMRFNLLASGLLSIGALFGILLLARPFIVQFLGARWEPAATILVILAPMLALRSLTMSIATTVFVLKRAHWLFMHNIANMAAMALAFAIAWASGAGLYRYLELSAIVMGVEYAGFATFLIYTVRQRKRTRAGSDHDLDTVIAPTMTETTM